MRSCCGTIPHPYLRQPSRRLHCRSPIGPGHQISEGCADACKSFAPARAISFWRAISKACDRASGHRSHGAGGRRKGRRPDLSQRRNSQPAGAWAEAAPGAPGAARLWPTGAAPQQACRLISANEIVVLGHHLLCQNDPRSRLTPFLASSIYGAFHIDFRQKLIVQNLDYWPHPIAAAMAFIPRDYNG